MKFKFSIGDIKYKEIRVCWVELEFGRQETIILRKACLLIFLLSPQSPVFVPMRDHVLSGLQHALN